MFEGVQQLPKLLDGEAAYMKAGGERMYQPRFQPEKAVEYAGNVGDFLEKLETEYKMPQLLPELLPFTGAAEAAKQQAKKAVKQGALTAASRMDAGPKAGSMAAQRGAVKLCGGNCVDTDVKRSLGRLKQDDSYPESFVKSVKEDLAGYEGQPQYADDADRMRRDIAHMEQTNAFNKWVDTKAGSYIRNQMATPDDPVVKMLDVRAAKIEADYQAGQKRLAKLDERIAQAPTNTTEEQNTLANLKRTRSQRAAEIESDRELAMTSMLPNGKDYSGYSYLKNDAATLINEREKAGFPIAGYGQSDPAKAWEATADFTTNINPASKFQGQKEKIAAAKEADKALKNFIHVELRDIAKKALDEKVNISDKEKKEIWQGANNRELLSLVGPEATKKYNELSNVALSAKLKVNVAASAMAEDNPYLAKLPPETPVYNAFGLGDLGIDHIIDVMKDDVATGKLKLEDLNKITMDQAVKRAAEYDFEMAKKARDAVAQSRASMPVYKEYPEGYKWVQLTKPGDFNAESNAMGHSVRGYEPEKGDPDWTPESGDSGRSDYGHGGWEAIKSGKAKVYSLIDPSGRPHTTIEVMASSNPYPVSGEAFARLSPAEKAQFREHVMQWRRRNPDVEELTDEHTTQALKEAGVPPQPDIITQIKGKGNARPAEKYDPYTQDFVRSGKWSNVNRNDLRNTGLIEHSGKYFTEPEFVEAAKKYGRMGVQNTNWETAKQRHIDAGVPEEEALLNWVEAFKDGRGTLDIPDEPNMAGGGLLSKIGKAAKAAEKVMPTARIGLEAPGILIPSKMNNVREAVRNIKGNYGARRVERAADEIPNLETMFQEDALKEVFTGDNARGVMTIDPVDFEKYAQELSPRAGKGISHGLNVTGNAKSFEDRLMQQALDKYDLPTDEYIQYLQQLQGGFSDVPYLNLFKDEVGLPDEAKVIGHEGRHRNRALAAKGDKSTLVQIQPRGDLREGMPRRTQEDFIEALRQELDAANRLVVPESEPYFRRPSVQLPDVYAKGGEVNGLKNALNNLLRTDKPEAHMSGGGVMAKVAKAAEATAKAAKAAEYLPGIHYADPLKMPTMKMSEALGNAGAEGKTLNFTETDRSRVFGPNRGGAGFSGLQHYSLPHKEANTVWGFGNKTTAEKKIRQNDPENTIWTTYAGSPNQHKSNTIVVKDALSQLQSANSQGLVNSKQVEFINDRIRSSVGQNGNPLFPKDFDITDPKAFDYATTFDRRAAISDALMGIGVKKPMISKEFKAANPGVKWSDAANINAILRRETDPAMLDANTFDVGPHLFTMDNGVIERPDLNEAFPYQVTGTDLGLRYELAPMRAAAPDWIKARNIKPDEPINAWAMSRAEPKQFVSEAYLTSLQKQGKKKGGLAQTKKVKRHGNTVPH
jgi:hypothetical protein